MTRFDADWMQKYYHVLAVLLIAVTTIIIYSNIFQAPFVFDDVHTIQENINIRNLNNYFTPEVLQFPRPLVDLTFALNYHFGKLHVFGYHLINILIHIGNGILVFYLSLRLFQKLSAINGNVLYVMALFSALIFTAHPLQTQAVTYTAQRYTSMAAFFYLLAVLCYMLARDMQSRSMPVQVTVFFSSLMCGILAFLCKQNSASLPIAIILIEYACYDRTWQGWKNKLKWIFPGILLIGFFYLFNMGLFRHNIQIGSFLEDVSSAARDTGHIGRWQYLCTQFNVIPIYMRLMLIPVHQNLDYLYPLKNGFFDGATPYGFLFLCLILFGGWRSKSNHPLVFVGVMWFFITLSVESSIFPIRDVLFEHRLYLPLFGFSLIAAYLCGMMITNYGAWVYGAAFVIVVSLSGATYYRNAIWQDDFLLWSNVVQRNPLNFRGWSSLATVLEKRGDFKAALAHYDRAIQQKPDYYIALYNKGLLLGRMGKTEDAISLFHQTLRIKPDYSKALINLGVALVRAGRVDDGVSYLQRALTIQPMSLQANLNLATIFVNSGKPEAAVEHYLNALRTEPESFEIHNSVGRILHVLSRYDEAAYHYKEAIRLNPKNPEAYLNLANSQMALNLLDDAMPSYKEAVRLKPDLVEGYINWGVACLKRKNLDEAIELFRNALKINPNLVEAHANLGNALYMKGKMAEAMQSFSMALRLKPDSREIRDNINRIIRNKPGPSSNPGNTENPG